MPDFVEMWSRSQSEGPGRVAEVDLIVFSEGALDDGVPLVAKQFGIPSKEAYAAVDVRVIRREDAAEWFDNWRSGGLRVVASHYLGAAVDRLDRADTCYVVRVSLPEPSDLGYLQAAWAVARWLVARGGDCVLDVHAGAFHHADAIAGVAADAGFDIDREVTLVYETDEDSAVEGHVLHTRGMRKFGRPDLVAVVDPDDAPLLSAVVRQIATALADGFMPAGRHGVDLASGLTLYLEPYVPGEQLADVHLNNDGMLLLDHEGNRPRGLAAALGVDEDGGEGGESGSQ